MQRPNYSKAPIIEAVIDLRVMPVEGFEVEQFDVLRELLQGDYPQFGFVETEQVEFRFEPEIKTEHNRRKNGILLSSEGSRRVLQARLDGFTFSQRAPYSTWEVFRDEARRLWNVYRSCYSMTGVTRIAHRAINQLDIASESGVDLDEYLHTAPRVTPEFPDGVMRGFFMQLQIWQPDLECFVLLNEALAPPPRPNTVSVILDFDLFRERFDDPWSSKQDEEMWHFLERLHVRSNEMFEASITDKTKELLK